MPDEFGDTIRADLRYLRDSWTRVDEVDDHELRRNAVVLRRLLVENDLQKYRKRLGMKGEPKLRVRDLVGWLAGQDRKGIQFATAGGIYRDLDVLGAQIWSRALSDAEVRDQYERGDIRERTMVLTTALQSPCMIIDGRAVARRSVIKYIANRKGGVHFDDQRREIERPEVEAQFEAMETIMAEDYTQVAGKSAVYLQLLALGQALVDSEAVRSLLADDD